MPGADDHRAHRFVQQQLARWNPVASGPRCAHYNLTVGPHRVVANPLSYGCNLHVYGVELNDAPRSFTRYARRRDHTSWYVDVRTALRAEVANELLEWVSGQPFASSPPRAARSSATRRRDNEGLTNRRYGVEIEFNGISFDRATSALNAIPLREGWDLRSDGSVNGSGLELVSPPLRGEDGLMELTIALKALRSAGARVDASCGLHVHHEIRDVGVNGLRRVVNAWVANQDLLDFLVSPSRRSDNSSHARSYCCRWNERELATFNNTETYLETPGRYKTVNAEAFGRYGTIEFRQHQGTLEITKIEAWIKLGQSIIEACREAPLAPSAMPASGLRDLFGVIGLDEDAAAYLLGRAIGFNAPPEIVAYPAATLDPRPASHARVPRVLSMEPSF